jgi:hypothetical protein
MAEIAKGEGGREGGREGRKRRQGGRNVVVFTYIVTAAHSIALALSLIKLSRDPRRPGVQRSQ